MRRRKLVAIGMTVHASSAPLVAELGKRGLEIGSTKLKLVAGMMGSPQPGLSDDLRCVCVTVESIEAGAELVAELRATMEADDVREVLPIVVAPLNGKWLACFMGAVGLSATH